MRGSIKKRSKGSWSVVLDLPSGPDGRRRQKRLTIKGTRREAEAAAAAYIRDSTLGLTLGDTRVSVSRLIDEWLRAGVPRLAHKTYERYDSIARLHLKPVLGDRPVAQLRAHDIDAAVSCWRSGGRRDRKRGRLSDTSVRHIFDVLRTVLNQAIKWGYIAVNPCQNASVPKRADYEPETLNAAGARRLLDALHEGDLLLPVACALGTGARRGEFLALTWADIPSTSQMTIRHSLETISRRLLLKEPKSKRSRRSLTLTELAATAIHAQRLRQGDRFRALGLPPPTLATPVFDENGTFWDPDKFSSRFYRAVRVAGIPKVRLHDLRHSFATILLEVGVDLKVISDTLGHSGIVITANLYAHLREALKADAAKRFDSVMPPNMLVL